MTIPKPTLDEKHFVATGFITNLEHTKMLMVYHRKLGRWAAPGGHIEPNETPIDAMRREVEEETGIKIDRIYDNHWSGYPPECGKEESQMAKPYVMLYESIPKTAKAPAHYHMDFIFLCEANERQTMTGQELEVSDLRWFTWQEILEIDTFDSVKKFATKMLQDGRIDPV